MKSAASAIVRSRARLLTSAVGAALAILAGPARAQDQYQFTLIDSLVTTYDLRETLVWDISEAGVAVGKTTVSDTDGNGNIHITDGAAYWINGVQTRINVSLPHGVNNNGFIVGNASAYDIGTGQYMTFPILPGLSRPARLMGVNDGRIAVGYEETCTCSNSQGLLQVPYVWSAQAGVRSPSIPGATGLSRVNVGNIAVGWIGGNASPNSFVVDLNTDAYTLMAPLFPPPADGYARRTTALDINDQNTVTGSRLGEDFVTTYGYTWTLGGGAPALLPFMPAPAYQPVVRPQSINNGGVVVGGVVAADGYERAFVYDAAHGIRDLNTLTTTTPGFVMRTAYRVNDNGWIVGYGAGGGGFYKSFLLRPMQEACPPDFNHDGDVGTDADIEAFFACLAGSCCATCSSADYNGDGDVGTDADIEAFFRVLAGGAC